MKLIDLLKELLLPMTSLVFSSFAFGFTLKNELEKKMNITVDFLENSLVEWLVDRESNEEPDVYHQAKIRFLPTVAITNRSSLPITITGFVLDNSIRFTKFSRYGRFYQVTIQSNKKLHSSGVISYGGTNKVVAMDLDENAVLQPPVLLKPYESLVGVLFFAYEDSLVGNTRLSVVTSRGKKVFQIRIAKQLVSQLITDYRPPQLNR
ncbi:hypothetical protein IGI39_004928 [Enterococcus sp. AZ135]|uniref:hypothetical protein n=1 Tax=unclassified Enterococcus TaxID=2608891 RepID=UPI003F21CFC3